jgi:O-antigen/teichoic acid export membrane protein
LLRVFGPDYAREGSGVLRLLALAAIPHTVIALNVSMLRVARRMRALAILQGGMAILVIVLSVVLLPVFGINGVGWAWLITMTLVAGVVLLTNLRFLWLPVLLDGPVGRRIVATGRGSRRENPSASDVMAGLETIVTDLEAL